MVMWFGNINSHAPAPEKKVNPNGFGILFET